MVRRRCLFVLGVFLLALSCSSTKNAEKTKETRATDSAESPDFIQRQGTSGASEQHPSSGTLNRRLTSRVQNFNWLGSRRKSKEIVRYYVHRQFARRSQTDPGQWRPELARDIDVNKNHTEYTIFLKKGVQWQIPPLDTSKEAFSWLTEIDRELTAEDCIFAFRMAREPDVGAKILRKRFSKINKIEKVNRYAFRVTWAEPYFPSRASTLGFFPLPKWLYSRSKKGEPIPESRIAENFNSHWSHRYPIGVGPYRFEQTKKTDHLTLAQYSNYDGEPPSIEQIAFKVIPKAKEAYHALKSGTLDIAGFSPQFFSNHIGERLQDGFNYKAIDKLAYHYIGWNARKRLFSEPRVRQALSHALDRNKMIGTYLHGFAHAQSGPFYHRSQAADPEVEAPKHDLQKADKLLTDAGWQDIDDDGLREKKIDGTTREFQFTLLSYDKQPTKKIVYDYRQQLSRLGIEMKIKTVGWPTMQKRKNRRTFSAYTGGWRFDWAHNPYQLWHSSQAKLKESSNYVGFKDERADKVIERLRRTFDRDKRVELLREFHRIIHDQQPYAFLYAPQTFYIWQSRLGNVDFTATRPRDVSLNWEVE